MRDSNERKIVLITNVVLQGCKTRRDAVVTAVGDAINVHNQNKISTGNESAHLLSKIK